MFGVRLCVAIIAIAAAIIALWLLRRFRMTKDDHTMLRAAIATKHKYGSVTLTDEEKRCLEEISGQKFEATWLGRDNDDAEPHPLIMNEDGEYEILLEKEREKERLHAQQKEEIEI